MVESTKVNGKKTNSTAKESTLGRMAESTKESTKTIRSTVSVHIHGPTEKHTKVCGPMENSMERLDSPTPRVGQSWVFGKTVKG